MKPRRRDADRECPLCGGRRVEVITDLTFSIFDDCPLRASFSLVSCLECDFCYYDTRSTPASFNGYYRGNAYYFSAETPGSGGSGPEEQRRFGETAECLASHLAGKSAKIFDVGCGKGGLLSVMKEGGFFDLYAVDMLPECIDYVAETLGVRAECGSGEALPFDGTVPDCIIYSHVLEHAIFPRGVLDEARGRLADDGVIYIEVPDAARYGESSAYPYVDLNLEHVNHLDMTHMCALAAASGFEAVETGVKALHSENGSGTGVPCIYGVFKKSRKRDTVAVRSRALSVSLLDYIRRCDDSRVLKIMDEVSVSNTPVYVWGISQYAQLLLGHTSLGKCRIKELVDGNVYKRSKTIGGRRILPPEILADAGSEDAVILTAVNYLEQMRRFLKEIRFVGYEIELLKDASYRY